MRNLWLFLLPTAAAHQPSLMQQELDVANPYISCAVNGTFASGQEVYTVRLAYERAFALPFELLVEKRSGNQDFRPMYAVVGPGLPQATEEERSLLPRELPDGVGLYLDLNDDEDRRVVFESVMRRVYWSTESVALALPPGAFEVWVWSPDGATGDFVLGFGVEEDFSNGFGGLFADWSAYAY